MEGIGMAYQGICYCDRKVVICEFSFFLLPNKTEWAIVYSRELLCLHSAKAVHTVQINWICKLGRLE